MMGDILKFQVTHHSLNLYGQCRGACDRKLDTKPEAKIEEK
jgi:Fur family ferric uptake transcriptional regulator